MAGVRTAARCAALDRPGGNGLGRYQRVVVAIITGLLLALVSVPDVRLPLQ
jgi:hypothetical protein